MLLSWSRHHHGQQVAAQTGLQQQAQAQQQFSSSRRQLQQQQAASLGRLTRCVRALACGGWSNFACRQACSCCWCRQRQRCTRSITIIWR